jgi:hypothetical protein
VQNDFDFMIATPLTQPPPPAQVSAAIPARAFKGMSAIIFLRRLWKIPWLTTSIRQPNHHVNDFWDTKATIATLRASISRRCRERHPALVE